MYICVSLPVNETYLALVSLRQSVLCGYDNVTFFLEGVLDTPYSFSCEATDWLQAFGPPVEDFALGVSVVILNGATVVQILKGVGASTIQ